MIRTFFAAALALGAIAGSAEAMPLAPFGAQANGDVIAMAGGCLKNFEDPAAHACPRGYHIGPGGACRGNGK